MAEIFFFYKTFFCLNKILNAVNAKRCIGSHPSELKIGKTGRKRLRRWVVDADG
jgi:hypothetical protein